MAGQSRALVPQAGLAGLPPQTNIRLSKATSLAQRPLCTQMTPSNLFRCKGIYLFLTLHRNMFLNPHSVGRTEPLGDTGVNSVTALLLPDQTRLHPTASVLFLCTTQRPT